MIRQQIRSLFFGALGILVIVFLLGSMALNLAALETAKPLITVAAQFD